MVNIFENKEKHTFYLISENSSLVECKLSDLEKISKYYNNIFHSENVRTYLKTHGYASAVDNSDLVDRITNIYSEYREEGEYERNVCVENAVAEFADELKTYFKD